MQERAKRVAVVINKTRLNSLQANLIISLSNNQLQVSASF